MAAHREAIQKQIHQDWANREYIEVITASIKRITDFLNSFGMDLLSIPFSANLSWLTTHIRYRYVLPIKTRPTEREIDYIGAEDRLPGEFCDQRRSAADVKPRAG